MSNSEWFWTGVFVLWFCIGITLWGIAAFASITDGQQGAAIFIGLLLIVVSVGLFIGQILESFNKWLNSL